MTLCPYKLGKLFAIFLYIISYDPLSKITLLFNKLQ